MYVVVYVLHGSPPRVCAALLARLACSAAVGPEQSRGAAVTASLRRPPIILHCYCAAGSYFSLPGAHPGICYAHADGGRAILPPLPKSVPGRELQRDAELLVRELQEGCPVQLLGHAERVPERGLAGVHLRISWCQQGGPNGSQTVARRYEVASVVNAIHADDAGLFQVLRAAAVTVCRRGRWGAGASGGMLTADGGLVAPHAPAVDVHPLPAARHTGPAGRPGGDVRQGVRTAAAQEARRRGAGGGRGCGWWCWCWEARGAAGTVRPAWWGRPGGNPPFPPNLHTWRGGPGPGLAAASPVPRTHNNISRQQRRCRLWVVASRICLIKPCH